MLVRDFHFAWSTWIRFPDKHRTHRCNTQTWEISQRRYLLQTQELFIPDAGMCYGLLNIILYIFFSFSISSSRTKTIRDQKQITLEGLLLLGRLQHEWIVQSVFWIFLFFNVYMFVVWVFFLNFIIHAIYMSKKKKSRKQKYKRENTLQLDNTFDLSTPALSRIQTFLHHSSLLTVLNNPFDQLKPWCFAESLSVLICPPQILPCPSLPLPRPHCD